VVKEALPKFVERVCRTHGRTEFVLEGGYYRCKRCRMQRVIDWRRRAKLRLIAEAGGCCQICGYDRYSGALHFHHRDPSSKEFGIARKGVTRSIEKIRAEVAKCVLLCSNCHAEVEAGVATLPACIPGWRNGSAADC
jgi:5-methylcytosine-specific restriction endonuclease McrA